jgi:hypothetical protein
LPSANTVTFIRNEKYTSGPPVCGHYEVSVKRRFMPTKRLVLGKDAEGVSRVLFQDEAPRVVQWQAGTDNMALLWDDDLSSPLSFSGDDPTLNFKNLFPPVGGVNFQLLYFPKHFGDHMRPETYGEALDLAGMVMNSLTEDGGWHSTATIDFGAVLEGAIDLKMRNGDTVTLRAGDTFVQRGGEHACEEKRARVSRR